MNLSILKIRNELDLPTGRYLNILVITDGTHSCEVSIGDAEFTALMDTFREGMETLDNPANVGGRAPSPAPAPPPDEAEEDSFPLGPDVDLIDDDYEEGDDGWVVAPEEESDG